MRRLVGIPSRPRNIALSAATNLTPGSRRSFPESCETGVMSLMSPYVWPWVLIGLSCLVTFLTGLDLPTKLRNRRLAGPSTGKSAETAATESPTPSKRTSAPVSVRIVRNSGLFWFCAGIVTVVHTCSEAVRTQPGAWIQTLVGLFWVVLGWKLFRSTFLARSS